MAAAYTASKSTDTTPLALPDNSVEMRTDAIGPAVEDGVQPELIDVSREQLSAAIDNFATGVTVVTTTTPAGLPLGSIANAVYPVSLDPPLVVVCLRNESDMLAVLLGRGCFAVNVLHQDQLAHARHFADSSTQQVWTSVEHRRSRYDLPLLVGAVATLQCRLHDVVDGGDHKIVIGRVLEVERSETDVDPLIVYRGAFAKLGERHEGLVHRTSHEDPAEVFIPTPDGELRLLPVEHREERLLTSVVALVGSPQRSRGSLVYLHAGCLFGDALGHLHCRRRVALMQALARIRAHGTGVLVYHRDDSSPFAGCCANAPAVATESAPTTSATESAPKTSATESAPTTSATESAPTTSDAGALRDALRRLRMREVRLLQAPATADRLDHEPLDLDVASVETLGPAPLADRQP